jgi:hypothetical protein
MQYETQVYGHRSLLLHVILCGVPCLVAVPPEMFWAGRQAQPIGRVVLKRATADADQTGREDDRYSQIR